jgi:hypothetical protein
MKYQVSFKTDLGSKFSNVRTIIIEADRYINFTKGFWIGHDTKYISEFDSDEAQIYIMPHMITNIMVRPDL